MITDIAATAGSQCVVLAIDTKKEEDGEWYVYLNGGRTKTDKKCFEWAKEAEDLGAGEILFTSMNNDGTKAGFALGHYETTIDEFIHACYCIGWWRYNGTF